MEPHAVGAAADAGRRSDEAGNRSFAEVLQASQAFKKVDIPLHQPAFTDKEATPKRILQLMGAKGVSISHIKSHLQMYRNMNNQIMSTTVHPFLSTSMRVHTRKILLEYPDHDPNPAGCVHSSSNSSINNGAFPWTSLEEYSSIESEPNPPLQFDAQFFKDNGRFNQNPANKRNFLHGSEIADHEDSSCKLSLPTYPYLVNSGLEKTKYYQEPIWQLHIDDDHMDGNRSKGHPTDQNHYFEGCINLELKISS